MACQLIQASFMIQKNMQSPQQVRSFCVYGDPAYPLRVQLQGPFRNAIVTPQMKNFNTAMSEVRASVEWLFGDISTYFKFVDKKNLELYLSSVGKYTMLVQFSEMLSHASMVIKHQHLSIQTHLHYKSTFPNQQNNTYNARVL